jgi:hypothetical protein
METSAWRWLDNEGGWKKNDNEYGSRIETQKQPRTKQKVKTGPAFRQCTTDAGSLVPARLLGAILPGTRNKSRPTIAADNDEDGTMLKRSPKKLVTPRKSPVPAVNNTSNISSSGSKAQQAEEAAAAANAEVRSLQCPPLFQRMN